MTRTDPDRAPDGPEPGSETLDVLVLAIPGQGSVVDLAIPATAVREIIRADRITSFPGAPVDVGGVIAVRGEIVLVLDVAPHPRQQQSVSHGAGAVPAVLITAATRTLALRGGTPVRLGTATPVEGPQDVPASLTLWSERALPLAGAVRLADASRSDAAEGSVLPLLDVAALLADVIDGSEGGT